MTKWKYKNETSNTVYWDGNLWAAGEQHETLYPVPAELGLTCVVTGDSIDPVLFHSDITLAASEQQIVELPMPRHSCKLDLMIGTLEGTATVSFLSNDNTKVTIDDVRRIKSIVSWGACAKIYLTGGSDGATVSISVFEIV